MLRYPQAFPWGKVPRYEADEGNLYYKTKRDNIPFIVCQICSPCSGGRQAPSPTRIKFYEKPKRVSPTVEFRYPPAFPRGKIFHLSAGQISLRSNFTRRRRISLRRSRHGPPSPKGRLTDTEAVSFSLLLLLARSATHAEGVTLFCSLSTVHEKISHGRTKGLPYNFMRPKAQLNPFSNENE